jgi:acyl-CoA synthetase (NDP forming)
MTRISRENPPASAAGERHTALLEHEAYALLAQAGISTPACAFVPIDEAVTESALRSIPGAEIVLKIVSRDLPHKSDVGGVCILPHDAGTVAAGIERMVAEVRERAPEADLRGVLLVERVAFEADVPGSEYLLSARRDPAFGPVLFFALGGLLAEWYGRLSATTTRVVLPAEPFDRERALAAVARTPLGELALGPSRIHPRAPVSADVLGEALEGLARLICRTSADGKSVLEEIEINPLAACGGRLIALDAVARTRDAAATPSIGPGATGGAVGNEVRLPRPIARIRHLLHPRSAVVLGASGRTMNAGRIILRNLKTSAGIVYGSLYAVHPKESAIEGVRCYASVAELPETVDLAVVALPASSARDTITDMVRLDKARSIILIPGGFSEVGEQGLSRQIEGELRASRATAQGGPVLIGPNCLGIVSKGEYNTFFLPNYKLPFHDAPGENLVAVSQSGAYLVSFTSNLDGIIFPRASVSYGNELDLTASDFLEYYLAHEPDARIFAFYVEGFPAGEGQRFVGLVRRATRSGRAVVVYKAGKTALGAKAAASHTASMSGDYETARALLEDAGAIVTETLNMFEDYTKILTMMAGLRPRGRRVGVVTNAGFEAGAISDHLYSLELAAFRDTTCARVASALPDIAHASNPIDTTPMADTAGFIAAVEAAAADPDVDMLIVSAIPVAATLDVLAPDLAGEHSENIFAMGSLPAELVRVRRSIEKPMVVTIDSGRLYDPTVLVLQRAGIPVYRKIDRASRALSAFAAFHLGQRGQLGSRSG